MTPTKEQEEIIKTDEDIKVIALAGTGKTSTLHMYIKTRPKNSRILYLAFNKSVQLEAMEKFKDVLDAGTVKLDIRTAHSMAYGAIIGPNKAIYKEIGDINIEEIMDIVQTTDYVFATHIRKAIECFCQSRIKNVDKLDYLSYISVPESLEFAEKNITGILHWAKHILGKMFKGEIRITHDFYLKLYQLKKPVLNYDYILFDECFPYNQNIVTIDGKKQIGSIVNDFLKNKKVPLVKSYNEEKSIFEYKEVTNVWKRGEKELIKLYFSNPRVVKCTPNHKFLTLNGWIEARNLSHGDAVLASSKAQPYQDILNDDQMCLIKGGQLGDGSIVKLSTNIYRTKFIHGSFQKEYLSWKADILNRSNNIEHIEKNGYAQTSAYRIQTTGFYSNEDLLNRKNIIDKINEKILAVMIMDDGSLCLGKHGFHLHSCTAHGIEMNQYLSQKILEKFGVKSLIVYNKIKNCYFLTFKTNDSKKISEIIAKYVHPSMSYKVHKEYRDLCGTYEWDKKTKSYGCLVFLKSELLKNKEEVYDIEVRDNHNFLLTSSSKRNLAFPELGTNSGIIAHNCQDASELMLDIVQSQKAIKLFVGDSHQQIYSWRNAVDSLKKVDGKEFKLTKSWRFPSSIANLASSAVLWKEILDNDGVINMAGMGTSTNLETKAIIGRTNAKLITRAIKDVLIDKIYTKPYFEGGFHNYAVKNAFSVVDDILAIKNKNLSKIKSKKLKHLKDMDDLLTFINQCEDAFLSLMVELVNTYGKNLPDLINKLEKACVSSKYDADIIFSSLHKSKGMEYDEVTLLDDFIGLQKLVDKFDNAKDTPFEEKMKVMLNEEINLLYVGITRSKNKLNLSKGLLKDLSK